VTTSAWASTAGADSRASEQHRRVGGQSRTLAGPVTRITMPAAFSGDKGLRFRLSGGRPFWHNADPQPLSGNSQAAVQTSPDGVGLRFQWNRGTQKRLASVHRSVFCGPSPPPTITPAPA
jgi:hypothetical protein